LGRAAEVLGRAIGPAAHLHLWRRGSRGVAAAFHVGAVPDDTLSEGDGRGWVRTGDLSRVKHGVCGGIDVENTCKY